MNWDYKHIRQALIAHYPDFQKKQRQLFWAFFLKVFLVEALVIIFAIGSYKISLGAACSCIAAGILLFGVLLKKSKFFRYRFLGEVTAVSRASHMTALKGYTKAMREQVFTTFTVTTENGNKMEIELPVPYEKVFKKGDRIIRFSGMDFPVDLKPEEFLICPFCGNIFPKENKVCVECGTAALNAGVLDSII